MGTKIVFAYETRAGTVHASTVNLETCQIALNVFRRRQLALEILVHCSALFATMQTYLVTGVEYVSLDCI